MVLGAILGRIKRDPSFLPFMSRQVGTALRRRLSRWSTPKDVQ
jgi:hypothetical protein